MHKTSRGCVGSFREQTGGGGDAGCGLGDRGPVTGVAEGCRLQDWSRGNTCRSARRGWWWWGGGAAAETALPPPPRRGTKETVGVGFAFSVFPYPPLSHGLFVALFGDASSLLRLRDIIWINEIKSMKKAHLMEET